MNTAFKYKIQKVLFGFQTFLKVRKLVFFLHILLLLSIPIILITCKPNNKSKAELKIGFSQCTGDDEWRSIMNSEITRECKLVTDYNIELTIIDAKNNSEKQIEDVKKLIDSKVDVILISPKEAKPLTAIVETAYKLGIPVIVVDRKIDSENFTAFVGGNNLLIGQEAGNYAAQILNGRGNVLEITGLEGSTPAKERKDGFHFAIENYDKLRITHSVTGKWSEELAEKVCDSILSFDKNIDLIYCHNDFMARGVYNSCVKYNFFPKIIGIDGLSTPTGGIQMVIDGKIDATFLYPSGGEKSVQIAIDVISGKPFKKYNNLFTVLIDKLNAKSVLYQENQIKEQFDKIDQQQVLIGRMQYLIHKQFLFLVLSVLIILLVAIVTVLIWVLLKNRNKTNAVLIERNQLIASQNEEIKTQRDNLEELNDTKDKLFTIIAHDLINPFNVIMGFADLLKTEARTGTPEEIEEQANIILQASEDAHNLLNNLLQWARSQQNVIKFNVSPVLLSQILENELKILRKHAENKSIKVNVAIENAEKEVAADKNLIGIVIRNLITNAIKFSLPGKSIFVVLNFGNEIASFSVKDEGVGMTEKQVENLFAIKSKSSTKGTQGERGTGLGLLVCKDFIEKHNGKLTVESQMGVGSKFSFALTYC